jgi:transposase
LLSVWRSGALSQRWSSLGRYGDGLIRLQRNGHIRREECNCRGPLVNAALDRLSPDFDQIYSPIGRPSIPPEQLLRALLLQAFFTIRSERQLIEQLTYNILFRWFVGMSIEMPVWDVTVFTKNRDRLLEGDIAYRFLRAILTDPQVGRLLSNDHFSVDGTLIEAWASMKSFRPKDGSGGL